MLPNIFFRCREDSECLLSSRFIVTFALDVFAAKSGCWLPPNFDFFFFGMGATSLQQAAAIFFSSQGPLTIANLVLSTTSFFYLFHLLLDSAFIMD